MAARDGVNAYICNARPTSIYRTITRHRVTYMCCAPVVFSILLYGVSGSCEEWDQVRHMSCSDDVHPRWGRRGGGVYPSVVLVHALRVRGHGPRAAPRRRAGPATVAQVTPPGVVRLLRTLVANHCVEVEGTLLQVVTRRPGEGEGDGAAVEARAVVQLNIYIPVAVWSGWQFPRSRSAAAAVFKHVRCVSSVFVYLYRCNFVDPIAILEE
jgi:hypothetical protein